MPKNSGLLVFFDEEQRRALLQSRSDGLQRFSDALSIPDWRLRALEVGLLAFSASTIDCVALLKKGKRVVTAKARVEFSDLVPLVPIPIKQIEELLNDDIRHYFIKSSKGFGGVLPDKTWERVIEIIKKLQPGSAKDIDRLMSLRSYSGYQLKGGISELLVQEREALGTALDIFSGSNQLREKVLRSWAPPTDSIESTNDEMMEGNFVSGPKAYFSFLDRLSKQYRNEESALQHDLFNWRGIQPAHIAGRSVFIQGHRQLEVFYGNRNALEKTLGVDLIYYNEEFELFALVQYKMMKKDGDKAIYRPDQNLPGELQRMDEFVEQYAFEYEMRCHSDFRLNPDGFLIKLVPNEGLRPASGELVQGMYLTREYVKFLLGPNGPRGDKDGRLITFKNAPRHLTNSDFTLQIRKGWLGMRGIQTSAVKRLIRHYYETGRAVLVAHEKEF
jgi:hypothetical protein